MEEKLVEEKVEEKLVEKVEEKLVEEKVKEKVKVMEETEKLKSKGIFSKVRNFFKGK